MTEEQKKIVGQVVEWAKGQPFNNLLLLGILVGGMYTAIKLVPLHLAQIQSGYEKIDSSNRALFEKMDKEHREERERTQQLYDRWMNRTGISIPKSTVAKHPE